MTRRDDPVGSIRWTERTGGVLTTRECVTLAPPLLRGELGILAGRLAMALRLHSGRRASVEPVRLAPPDSSLACEAQDAADDLLAPVLRNHSHRAFAWAAAIAARRGISFDRELLYLAAMFHDTGLPSPVSHVDFTVRSAAPDAVRRHVVEQFPRLGFKRDFAAPLRAEAKQVPRGRAWYLHRFAVSDLSIRLAPFS